MKLNYTILIAVAFSIVFGCDKASEISTENKIIGTWISADKSEILEFVNTTSFYRSSTTMKYDHYDYKLLNDSIKIGYNGILNILVTPTLHSYKLSGEKLTIDFSNRQCYGFELEKIDYYKK